MKYHLATMYNKHGQVLLYLQRQLSTLKINCNIQHNIRKFSLSLLMNEWYLKPNQKLTNITFLSQQKLFSSYLYYPINKCSQTGRIYKIQLAQSVKLYNSKDEEN